MRWCRFEVGDHAGYGVVEGDTVVAVEGSPFGRYERTGATYPVADVRLLAQILHEGLRL